MWKKLAAAGAVGAAVVGVATAAMAADTAPVVSPGADGGGSALAALDPTNPASTSERASATDAAPARRHALRQRLRAGMKNAIHGEFVTRSEDGTFVTHDVYRGDVTSVSPTSVAVKAADGTSLTYSVGADTKVFLRNGTKRQAGTIGDVKTGDSVVVAGTGAETPTATVILDRG